MRIELSEGAEQDLIAGATAYDRREVGVGNYFLDSLFSDIDTLAYCGGSHRVITDITGCFQNASRSRSIIASTV